MSPRIRVWKRPQIWTELGALGVAGFVQTPVAAATDDVDLAAISQAFAQAQTAARGNVLTSALPLPLVAAAAGCMALATVAWMPHGHALALVGGLHVSGPSFGKDLAGLSCGSAASSNLFGLDPIGSRSSNLIVIGSSSAGAAAGPRNACLTPILGFSMVSPCGQTGL